MSSLKAYSLASKNLITIGIDEKVERAHEIMRSKKIRHLVVVDKGKVIGVLSDQDLMKALKMENADFYSLKAKPKRYDPKVEVGDVMNWPTISVDEATSLEEVIDVFLNRKVSSLLVTQSDAVVGIVTSEDLLKILKQYVTENEKSSFGEIFVNKAYSTPIRQVMEVLANTGI